MSIPTVKRRPDSISRQSAIFSTWPEAAPYSWDCGADPRVDELIPLISGGPNPRTGKMSPGIGSLLPGTIVIANKTSLFEQGLSGGRSIDIEITGPELDTLVGLGGQIFGQVTAVLPGAQAQPIPSLDQASPEVHLRPKLLQAAEMGVTSADLGYTVNALVDGAYASDYFDGSTKIDLIIRSNVTQVRHTQDLAGLPVATPKGQVVPLGTLADIELTAGPEQVNRRERQRAITIRVKPAEGMALEDATR